MNNDATQFLAALGERMTDHERMILCMVPGDPGKAEHTAWKPRPYHPALPHRYRYPAAWNGYVTVGAFGRADDGSWRRRADHCTGGLALMIDDVGTKVPRETVSILAPTARIETSPGNEQWWYILAEPERDLVRFDALIRAFISGRLLGKDPGMGSITRVGRLPGFQNCKPEYGGWEVRLLELAERRYSVEELLIGFELELDGRREPPMWVRAGRLPPDIDEKLDAFCAVERMVERAGLFKKPTYDRSGWREMRCPWVEEHTGGVDNGAAMREPEYENGWTGAFRCHHGSHGGRGWRELTDWVAELSVESLEDTAEAGGAEFEKKFERNGNGE